jgi:hypothetical protein
MKMVFNDTLYNTGFTSKLEFGAIINFNTGPYEAIKSAGIDRITNDSLRNKLINYYDFELPFWEKIINEYSDKYEEDLEFLRSLSLEPRVYSIKDKNFFFRRYPRNLFQLSGFKHFLLKSKRRASGTKSMANIFIPKMQSVLDLINEEIKKYD